MLIVFLDEREIAWLPAIKVYGEGIFLELDMVAVDRWLREQPVLEHLQGLSPGFATGRLPLQVKAMRQYAKRPSWKVVKAVEDVGSGASVVRLMRF